MDKVLLTHLQLWDCWGSNTTWLSADTRSASPYSTRRDGSSSQSNEDVKISWVDNILAELVRAGGEAMIDILTSICNKIRKTKRWPTTWTQFLSALSAILVRSCWRSSSHRLQPQAEEIIADEQAGFRAGRSTAKQNSGSSERNTCCISRIYRLQEGIWQCIAQSLMDNATIIRVIESLYDKAMSAVLFHSNTGDWFRTTVGVREGCQLSPTLFDIERIMC